MALYRDVVSAVFTGQSKSYTFDGVVAVDISRGGKRLAASADANQRQEIVDSTDHTSSRTLYTKDFPLVVGSSGSAALAPLIGDFGTLTVTTRSAADLTDELTFTLGDNSTTFARRMPGSGAPKHADIEANGVIHFRGYCPAGDTCPLAQS